MSDPIKHECGIAVVRLRPKSSPSAEETPRFRALVRAAFQMRRKTLRNALAGLVALFGLVMLTLAVFFVLVPYWGQAWAALAVVVSTSLLVPRLDTDVPTWPAGEVATYDVVISEPSGT